MKVQELFEGDVIKGNFGQKKEPKPDHWFNHVKPEKSKRRPANLRV
jgi:hypothetical protein